MAFNLKLPKFLAGSKATKDQVEATASDLARLARRIEEKTVSAARHVLVWCLLSGLGGAVLALAFALWKLAPTK